MLKVLAADVDQEDSLALGGLLSNFGQQWELLDSPDPASPLAGTALRHWWRAFRAAWNQRRADERLLAELSAKIETLERDYATATRRGQEQLRQQLDSSQRQQAEQLQLLAQEESRLRQKLDQERRHAEEDLRSEQQLAVNDSERRLQHDTWEVRSIYEGTSPTPRIRYHQALGQIEAQVQQQGALFDQAARYLQAAGLHAWAGELESAARQSSPNDPAAPVEQILAESDAEHAPPDHPAVNDNAAEPATPPRSVAECQEAFRAALSGTLTAGQKLRADWRIKLLQGPWPILFTLLPGVLLAACTWWWMGQPATLAAATPLAISLGIGLAAGLAGTIWHKLRVRGQLSTEISAWKSLRARELDAATELAQHALRLMQREKRNLREKLARDLHGCEEKFRQRSMELQARQLAQTRQLTQTYSDKYGELSQDFQERREEINKKFQPVFAAIQRAAERDQATTAQAFQTELAENRARRRQVQQMLAERWTAEVAELRAAEAAWRAHDARLYPDWDDPCWEQWLPSTVAPRGVPFGQLTIEHDSVAGSATLPADAAAPSSGQNLTQPWPDRWTIPAVLDFPRRSSLVILAQDEGRDAGLQLLQALMLRLLLSIPPAKSRFTIIDPVGLGKNFAGMMHLADYDDTLVTNRIWTEPLHIEQRLTDLSEQIETIIQKYLRNEFASIDAYNLAAGEVAEPFRFLVVANFPRNFTEAAARRLQSIAASGPRCGVFVLLLADTRQNLPSGFQLEDLAAVAETLVWKDGEFHYADRDFGQFALAPLDLPPEEMITRLVHAAGHAARDGRRVEVPFHMIAPPAEQFWRGSTRGGIEIPLGRAGARKRQALKLGSGTSQHVLMAGKTGSGKSTLLHAIIVNACLTFSPDELEVYLIDFKKGVEFKDYAQYRLPHARVVAIESEREFGLSALARLDAEMQARGELFRKYGKQDIQGYRGLPDQPALPRILLLIDEFQEFFTEDDRVSQQATLLLDRLVRQGRAFGIHLLLGSQTLGGAFTLARSTISQMGVRIALQCSESDADLILSDDNSAARLLNRPGEAIYNDANGRLEGNSPFQVAWLSEVEREDYLRQLREMADAALAEKSLTSPASAPPAESAGRDQYAVADWPTRRQVIFEGSAPANLEENRLLARALAIRGLNQPATANPVATPLQREIELFLGDPVSIKDPTTAPLRRQAGGNMLLLGQEADRSADLLAAVLVSLAARGFYAGPAVTPELSADDALTSDKDSTSAKLDAGDAGDFSATPASAPLPGGVWILEGRANETAFAHPDEPTLAQLARQLRLPTVILGKRDLAERLGALAAEVERRATQHDDSAPAIVLVIYNLSRFRDLRRDENDYGYSFGSEAAAVSPDKNWAKILREGPAVGVHTLVWCDTLANVLRSVDRATLREFDLRVLFQMNPSDSSQLVDSPAASKLGRHFALFSHEETGQLEKFRPYAWPRAEWLDEIISTGNDADSL